MVKQESPPNPYPDNVYFDGEAVSWVGESDDGFDARLGVIQDGFDETFPIPESGERIWLYEPTGEQSLTVRVMDGDKEIAATTLRGEGMVHVMGGYDINVVTPLGQGAVTYLCDYPGVKPGLH